MFSKNESLYYYDIQMKSRLTTCLNNLNSELREINSLFILFTLGSSNEKQDLLSVKKAYINDKYKNSIKQLEKEITKCNRRLKYNNSKIN